MTTADAEIARGRAAPGSPALPTDLPDDFGAGDGTTPGAGPAQPSLLADVEALIADGKTYLEAEVIYQKSRAGFAANRLKWIAVYGAAAFGLLHLALIALTVGVVIALAPLVGPWIATGMVVVLLLLGALVFVLRMRRKLGDIRDVFEGGTT